MQLAAQFPKPEGPEVIIDVSQFEERQLTAVSGDTYPLIIRLECVSDKGKTESHSLQVISSRPISMAVAAFAHSCARLLDIRQPTSCLSETVNPVFRPLQQDRATAYSAWLEEGSLWCRH